MSATATEQDWWTEPLRVDLSQSEIMQELEPGWAEWRGPSTEPPPAA